MTEAELQAAIIARLDRFRLFYHHCTHPELCQGDPGFPDLVIAGRSGHTFAELKSSHGQPSPAQRAWLGVLNTANIPRYPRAGQLWRPGDLADGGLVDAVLMDLARNRAPI